MNSFKVFVKKELLDHIRTKKFFIMIIIMLYSAFISAPSAKYLPDLLKALAGDLLNFLPEPTYIDGFIQFFKNVSQLGIFVLILILAGSVSKEKSTGSAVIVLTKPLTRATMVISKFTVTVALFSISYFAGFIIHIMYSCVLFNETGGANALIAALMMWYYCVLIIAVTISFSAASKKGLLAGLLSFAVLFLFTIISSVPVLNLNKYSPGVIATINHLVVEGKIGAEIPNMMTGHPDVFTWGDIGIASGITTVLIIIFITAGIKIFEKQEI